jgi:hypothetical protein
VEERDAEYRNAATGRDRRRGEARLMDVYAMEQVEKQAEGGRMTQVNHPNWSDHGILAPLVVG